MILRTICLLVALALVATAIAAESYPKVADYALDVTFFPNKSFMRGQALIAFAPGEELSEDATFYLHGELRVDSVHAGGRAAEFGQELVFYDYEYSLVAIKVTVDLSSLAADERLSVYYHGYFNPSKAAAISSYMRIDDDGVFLRSYGYSVWFPIFLEARKDWYQVDFSDVRIRTPKQFHAVFVGHHVGDEIVDDFRVSHWQALSTEIFSAQCTAQEFEITSEGEFHAYHWKDSDSKLAAHGIIKAARELAAQFKVRYKSMADAGEYYFMQMPAYADISADNVTGIYGKGWKNFVNNERAIGVLAHEMLHPFVDVGVQRSDPLFALMIEGFPCYFDRPVIEDLWGEEWANESILKMEKRYLTSKETGQLPNGLEVPPEKPIDQITAEEVGEYKDYFILPDRCTLFLNYLRVKMSKERFDKFAYRLFNDGPMNSERFRALIMEFAPKIDEDVTVWLSTNDYPDRFHLKNLMPGIVSSP